MKQLKSVGRLLLIMLASSFTTIAVITACGGGSPAGNTVMNAAHALIFNSNPVGLHVTSGFGPTRTASTSSPFVVNAQATTPGGGNFSGFCNATVRSGTAGFRVRIVIFGLGRWTSGSCEDGQVQFSNVGVNIPAAGQIGNLTVDAIGTGVAADSGQLQLTVLHSDGSQTIAPLTCSLGVSSNTKVHCEDKNTADHTNVAAGDQLVATFFYTPCAQNCAANNGTGDGDSYTAIRVNVQYATPTF